MLAQQTPRDELERQRALEWFRTTFTDFPDWQRQPPSDLAVRLHGFVTGQPFVELIWHLWCCRTFRRLRWEPLGWVANDVAICA